MGCSYVSEFEHIYGQISTTPSCVYDRLFTWTVMVDFNALIVWKTLLDICFSVKSSLWAWQLPIYEIPNNDLVDDMKLWPPVTFPDAYSTVTSSKRRETSLWKSWKHTTLWFPGGSSHCSSWSAYLDSNCNGIGAFLRRKLWHYFVQITWRVIPNMGWPHITPVCLGSHSQEPCLQGTEIRMSFTIGVPRILKWRRFTSWGAWQRVWGASPPVELWGKAPVEGLGDEEKCEINLQLLTFSCRKSRI